MKMHIEMSEKEMRYCGDLASILGLPGFQQCRDYIGDYEGTMEYPEKYLEGLHEILYNKYYEASASLVAAMKATWNAVKSFAGVRKDMNALMEEVMPLVKYDEKNIFLDKED